MQLFVVESAMGITVEIRVIYHVLLLCFLRTKCSRLIFLESDFLLAIRNVKCVQGEVSSISFTQLLDTFI